MRTKDFNELKKSVKEGAKLMSKTKATPYVGEEIREYFPCNCGCHLLALTAWKWHKEIEPEIFLSMFNYGPEGKHYKTEIPLKKRREISGILKQLVLACKSISDKDYDFVDKIDMSADNIDEDRIRHVFYSLRDIMDYGSPYGDSIDLSPKDAKRLSTTLNRLGSMKVKKEKPIKEQTTNGTRTNNSGRNKRKS